MLKLIFRTGADLDAPADSDFSLPALTRAVYLINFCVTVIEFQELFHALVANTDERCRGRLLLATRILLSAAKPCRSQLE